MLAPRAHRIATGFAETQGLRATDRGRAVHTGNPVRPPIQAVGTTSYAPPTETIELLVTGGSQGAHVFSEIVPSALALLPAELRGQLRVAQQARPEDKDAVVAQYGKLGIAASVESFFTDMPERLRRAHLVICRAGASTLAELAAAGRPAILVPFPHAMDDHQTANAAQFAASGAGWAIAQPEFTATALVDRLARLLADPQALADAAKAARAFARDDAAEHLAGLVQSLIHGRNGGEMERAA
jgi:UDP-N-acetylglucosamine--N-acetylmuramyl-(pentapeptide) pyrophosphoryl-undecaprenol N-acetylglucosamine transferase